MMRLFRFLKWPILGGFGFLLLVGVIFKSIRFLTSAPSKADCEIFKVLTADIYARESGHLEFFKPYILPLDNRDFKNRISWVSTVVRRTDQKKIVPARDGYDSYEFFLTEEVSVDLSSKTWASTLKERKNLGKCYKRKERPNISNLGLNTLALREAARSGSTDVWPNIWQIQEVIRSNDKQHVIVFAHSYCGGLCAWGGFYLLEKSNEDWTIVGYHTEWVS